jgi:cytochrome d ubiquinol oxidase subunit II
MDLNTVWFVLIGVLYLMFFLLEGFDLGVGILLPFLGKDDLKRRAMINTIGPHWDGNEVWLLTAGGATFAAFPEWYATLFGGFYLALFLILLALILRGVAFEFRGKDPRPRWRALWDGAIFVGSLLPALLLGVAMANWVRGVPIDPALNYVGGFFDLLNPYALVFGVTVVLLFALHGAVFLSLKTTDELMERSRQAARRLWLPSLLVFLLFAVLTYLETDIVSKLGVNPGAIPLLAPAALLAVGYLVRRGRDGWAFIMTGVCLGALLASLFLILYPRLMVSSLNPQWSLTIYNASSTPYTLRVMTIVALIFTPIVLVYQGWSYWIFRKRIEARPEQLTY